jgi:hypothetical protein
VLFHDDFFWVRFRKGPRNLLDLIIQIPELSNIAGSDRKSLPDQDENEVNIAS